MTKWAVFSDIHGNLPALEVCVADAQAKGCDGFLNLGDILSGPLWPAETAEYCMARGWPTIAGNHERQLLAPDRSRMGASDRFAAERLTAAHFDWIRALPKTMEIDGISLCHGSPRSDVEHLLYEVRGGGLAPRTADQVEAALGPKLPTLQLCGHSHLPGQITVGGSGVAINIGSTGLQAYDDIHPVDYRVEVGDPRARYAVVDDGVVQIRAVAYDHEAAALRAEANGFPNWAIALRTGRMR